MPIPIRIHTSPHEVVEADDHDDSASSPSSHSRSISRRSSLSISSSSSASLSRSRSALPRIVNHDDDHHEADNGAAAADHEAAATDGDGDGYEPDDEVMSIVVEMGRRRMFDHLIDGDIRDESSPMTSAFRSALTQIFHQYASISNPLAPSVPYLTMSKDDLSRYFRVCCASSSQETIEESVREERLDMIFRRFVPNEEWTNYGELTCEGFCEFYRIACFDRISNVWSDLKIHQFFTDVEMYTLDDFEEANTIIAIQRSIGEMDAAEHVQEVPVEQLSLQDEPPPAA